MKTPLFFTLALLLMNSNAWANAKVIGNGGIGIKCARSLELLDLFEGRVLEQKKPIEKSTPYRVQLLSYAENLSNAINREEDFQNKINEVLGDVRFLPRGIGLTFTGDANNFIYPRNCQLVQILNYRTDGMLYIDQDLWSKLNETQKAAALLHEVIYKYLRTPDYLLGKIGDGDQDSVRTRRIVSSLIAGQQLEPVRNTKLAERAKQKWLCRNTNINEPTTIFNVYENAPTTTVEFFILAGARMLTNTSFTVSWPLKDFGSIEDLKSKVDGDVKVLIRNIAKSESEVQYVIETRKVGLSIQQNVECKKY